MLAHALTALERSLDPLDRTRRALYRVLAPWLGPWIRDREVRVGLYGAGVAAVSLVGALAVPLWMLALGPLLLGVPHLVADLRYLVARPGLHRRPVVLPVVVALLATAVTQDLAWGLGGAALAALSARAPVARRWLAGLPLLGLTGAAIVWRGPVALGFAHAHNVVAVGLWLTLAVALHDGAPVARLARWGPTLAFAVGGLAILSGALDGVLAVTSALRAGPMPPLQEHARVLAAPGTEPTVATRWVAAFAFAQSVHYGLWLRVIPEEARDRPSTRSWQASFRSVRADLGGPVVLGSVVVLVGIAVWGVVDLVAARDGYLRLALFHGPLELAVLGVVAAEGRGALRPTGER